MCGASLFSEMPIYDADMRTWMLALAVLVVSGRVMAEAVRVGNFEIETTSLEVKAQGVTLSTAGERINVDPSQRDGSGVSWRLPDRKLVCVAAADGDTLQMTFMPDTGAITTLKFPVVTGEKTQVAYVLPLWEGKYIPAADKDFISKLAGDPEDLIGWSLPVMGVEYAESMATYLFPDPSSTSFAFSGENQQLGAAFEHKFTRLSPGTPYVVRLSLAKKTSLLEPALRWRAWTKAHGQFVSLSEKAAKLADVHKLAGAAHVYLWGADRFSRYDVKNWKSFAAALLKAAEGSSGSKVVQAMDKDTREALEKIASGEVDAYATGLIATAISDVLKTKEQAARFASDYAEHVKPREDWGDGVSAKFVRTLKSAGLDRLWLGVDGATNLARHPEAIAAGKGAGFLIGHYDSFESIHLTGEKETWETAQFPPELIPDPEALAVRRENGKPRRGFQQKGFALSSTASRTAVEARVRRDMAATHGVNSVFIDCDAFGQVYDDYSPAHPTSQAQDVAERIRRMQWIGSEFSAVIGSEGGVAYSTGVIHFAHGMTTSGIGWGDEEMKDKKSPYFLGAYFPPDGPAIFTKQVPLKPIYHKTDFDPRYRLPLFEAAYHDSVVTTHHWSSGSLKFKEEVGTQALVEMLYQLPPLYHLNHKEWGIHKAEILKHYAAFSPLHRKTWALPMTAFSYENEARTLQRSVFGDSAFEIIANFADTATNGIPPRSLRWRENGGEWQVWTP